MEGLVQNILKINLRLKPKVFLLGLMDKKTKRKYLALYLYMITASPYTEVEGNMNSHMGRMDEGINGIG